jgi:glucose-6-phosphate 1-dehydrogenase
VQITIAEKLGVGNRLGYYDTSGALRDMLQNHLLQLLCIVAMEPPTSIALDAARRHANVLRSLKKFTPTTLAQNIVRGQYRAAMWTARLCLATATSRMHRNTRAPKPSSP